MPMAGKTMRMGVSTELSRPRDMRRGQELRVFSGMKIRLGRRAPGSGSGHGTGGRWVNGAGDDDEVVGRDSAAIVRICSSAANRPAPRRSSAFPSLN